MSGYVRAQRGRFKHKLFCNEKFCRGYAWDWMVAQAAWKPHEIDLKGKTVRLERGQFCHWVRYMADTWGWSIGSVQRFLTRLKTETMVDTATEQGQTIVTICNYDTYQAEAGPADTAPDTPTDTAAIQQRYNKERREIKDNKGSKKDPREILLSVLGEEAVDDFLDHRKAKRAKVTPKAAQLIAAKLAGHPEPEAAIYLSIENGWTGVFPEKVKTNLTTIDGGRNDSDNTLRLIADAARAR